MSWSIPDVRSDGSNATCPTNQPLFIYRVHSSSLTMHARIMAYSDVRSDGSDATCPINPPLYLYRVRSFHHYWRFEEGGFYNMGKYRRCDLIYNAFNSFIGSTPSYCNWRIGVGDPLCIVIYCGCDLVINHVWCLHRVRSQSEVSTKSHRRTPDAHMCRTADEILL